jgi:hypothetical protein
MIEAQQIRPSAWWYAASAIPLVVGVAIGVLLIVNVVNDVASDLHHFTTPGEIGITLDDGDSRDIYVQTEGSVESTGFAVPASVLSCQVRGPNGPVPIKLADNTTLTTGGDRYRSRFTFTANGDGRYLVGCRSQTRPPVPVPLAVGPHLGVLQIVGSVFGVIAAFLLGFLLAGLVAGLVALLRHRSKVRLQREAAGPSWGPPGPTGGAPY